MWVQEAVIAIPVSLPLMYGRWTSGLIHVKLTIQMFIIMPSLKQCYSLHIQTKWLLGFLINNSITVLCIYRSFSHKENVHRKQEILIYLPQLYILTLPQVWHCNAFHPWLDHADRALWCTYWATVAPAEMTHRIYWNKRPGRLENWQSGLIIKRSSSSEQS